MRQSRLPISAEAWVAVRPQDPVQASSPPRPPAFVIPLSRAQASWTDLNRVTHWFTARSIPEKYFEVLDLSQLGSFKKNRNFTLTSLVFYVYKQFF